jgi:Domain of unknown function (DUF5597)
MQILTTEEGYYTPARAPGAPEEWHVIRILNGDETDRGIRFPELEAHSSNVTHAVRGDQVLPTSIQQRPTAVRILLGRF